MPPWERFRARFCRCQYKSEARILPGLGKSGCANSSRLFPWLACLDLTIREVNYSRFDLTRTSTTIVFSYVVLTTQTSDRIFSEKKYPICNCSWSNQMPLTCQITEISPYVRTYYCVTIWVLWSQVRKPENLGHLNKITYYSLKCLRLSAKDQKKKNKGISSFFW